MPVEAFQRSLLAIQWLFFFSVIPLLTALWLFLQSVLSAWLFLARSLKSGFLLCEVFQEK